MYKSNRPQFQLDKRQEAKRTVRITKIGQSQIVGGEGKVTFNGKPRSLDFVMGTGGEFKKQEQLHPRTVLGRSSDSSM